jgi:hydroxymethylpyrimidine pyrophosphatase-like HAD family hydrolase
MKSYKNEDPIRLVLADVDGTLVTQKKLLTPKTRQTVAKLGDAGIAFAITSGRPPRGMQSLIRDLKRRHGGGGIQRGRIHHPEVGSNRDA